MFAELTDEFIGSLRETVELVRYSPGQVICRQGDPADSFYLVRIGFVKVSQAHPGGDMVLAYLSRGDYFGETGLLAGDIRTATCTALDHVELVRIGADDFNRMMSEFPGRAAEAGGRGAGPRADESRAALRGAERSSR